MENTRRLPVKTGTRIPGELLLLLLFFSVLSFRTEAQTVGDLEPKGDNIKWYDAATGGNLVQKTASLVNGTQYYASQTVNGCESIERLAVTAIVSTVAAPAAGTHTAASTEVTWNWNAVAGATGYKWGTTDVYANATDMETALTKAETGLTCNTSYTRYIWAYNASGCISGSTTLTHSTASCGAACGVSVTVNHQVSGGVAPVNKEVTYGTVTNIAGEPSKCWITRNLGASQQSTSVNETAEAAAGWYWQFNRKQGYQFTTVRTPSSEWNVEPDHTSSSWETANDPCALELGTGWRIPTYTEWNNVDAALYWTNWFGPYDTPLKIHAAGYIGYNDAALYDRGVIGDYWSSTELDSNVGSFLTLTNEGCLVEGLIKSYAASVRCIRDY